MKGKNAGEKHERCRAITEEEMATEEMQAGGWYNAVATPVIQVAQPPGSCCMCSSVPAEWFGVILTRTKSLRQVGWHRQSSQKHQRALQGQSGVKPWKSLPAIPCCSRVLETKEAHSPAMLSLYSLTLSSLTQVGAMVQAAGLDILNAFPETVPLWSFHMWDKDCTHYCMPGPYELWTYMLTQKLKTTTFKD